MSCHSYGKETNTPGVLFQVQQKDPSFFFTQYFSTTRSVHARNMHMFTCVCNRVCRCTHPHVHAWWPEVNVRCLPLSEAHILIGLDKKNPESDTVTDAKDQRSTGASR